MLDYRLISLHYFHHENGAIECLFSSPPPPILFAKYASFCKQPSNTNYVGKCFFEIFENIK